MTSVTQQAVLDQKIRDFQVQLALQKNQPDCSKDIRVVMKLETLVCLSSIEDVIFEEASEAFEVLNQKEALRIDGFTYARIAEDPPLQKQLLKIRANAPIYQNWNSKKKEQYFDSLGQTYKRNLQDNGLHQEYLKTAQSSMQTPETTQAESKHIQKHHKTISKKVKARILKKGGKRHPRKPLQFGQACPSKECANRVVFAGESTVKFFAKAEAAEAVVEEREYNFPTFDKF